MKKIWIFVFCFVFTQSLQAQDRFGLGLVLGEPTGVSGDLWVNKNQSIDAALSFEEDIYLHTTYLFHQNEITPIRGSRWTWYAGAGVFFRR